MVGHEDPDDPNNNYYEYTVDETLCTGCGKCVKACKPPFGNGSLRLEIRYDRCVTCNECSILDRLPRGRHRARADAGPVADPARG